VIMRFLSFNIAKQNLRKNRSRTVLSLLGVVIGITSVIVVLSAGNAIENFIIDEIESFGSGTIEVEVKTPSTSQASAENAFSMLGGAAITTMTLDDADEIGKHPNISQYYGGVLGQEAISYSSELTKAFLFGVSADFINIDQTEVVSGRFFTKEEDNSLAKLAVLGPKLADKLFGQTDPVDNFVKLGKERFKVIGVTEERGATFGFDWDNMAIVPVQTLQKRILGIDYISFIFAQMIDTELGDQTVADMEWIMRDAHEIDDPDKDDFAVVSMEQAAEMMDVVVNGIQILLILLGSISLVVGGVGIMNIMYVSVTERTYEIGLRKAVGAKSSVIMWQFLWESVIITLIGGIIGIILGILLSVLISVGANSQGYNWDFSVSYFGMFLATLMSIVVGLVFGLYPAKKAAGLDPIEALRHE
jgi:ABC-type antimicrobial peptide transport system permease subunit